MAARCSSVNGESIGQGPGDVIGEPCGPQLAPGFDEVGVLGGAVARERGHAGSMMSGLGIEGHGGSYGRGNPRAPLGTPTANAVVLRPLVRC